MIIRRFGIALVATGALALAAGQALTKDEPAGDPMAAWLQTHKPSAAQQVLKSLEGSWNARVTMWMDPSADPSVTEGVSENVMILDGRYLEQYYSGEMMGETFEGRGLLAHDNDRKLWQMTWIDSWSSGMAVLEGASTTDYKTFSMQGVEKNPMGMFDVRWTTKVTSADLYVSTREARAQGTTAWQKDLEITYSRMKDDPMMPDDGDDDMGDDMGDE